MDKHVKPILKATFDLDQDGKPVRLEGGEKMHYQIRLGIENAPDDTYAVTYVLDDSYYEPIREARKSENKYAESLTSYGDYTVQAKIRTKGGILSLAIPLSEALSSGHEEITPDIAAALTDIKRN